MGSWPSLIWLRLVLLGGALSLVCGSPARAQVGDNDPDDGQGYVNNVFRHSSVDSVNLYNGQLTVPIAIGPSYPIGPKLKFQAMLTYNSRPNDSPFSGREPLAPESLRSGDPALGSGWTFALGAIKFCPIRFSAALCYFAPDGSQHVFGPVPGTPVGYYKTLDATQLYLHDMGTGGPYEMWDGDGNRYAFYWHVTGYDDDDRDYYHDFGRGRDGWYLTSLADPFGNSMGVTYSTLTGPCWHFPTSYSYTCPIGVDTGMRCAINLPSWIPASVTLPSGDSILVSRNSNGLVGSVAFPVFANGSSTYATWSLDYLVESTTSSVCVSPPVTWFTYKLSAIRLPSDVAGLPSYQFTYRDDPWVLMTGMTLPTGATVAYTWGGYSFYHGRASKTPRCVLTGPPHGAPVLVSEPILGPVPRYPIGSGCDLDLNRYQDDGIGVVARTETVSGVASTTEYTQYAFPFGEHVVYSDGCGAAGTCVSQTLTVVLMPPDVDGRRRAKLVLFWSGPGGVEAYPGDRIGADVTEAVFESDPNPVNPVWPPSSSPVCGGSFDFPFCPNHAVRVKTRGYEYSYDTAQPPHESNRRLLTETTFYGPTQANETCPGCRYHSMSMSNSGGTTWEGNGRHYTTEAHSGNLGNDSRTITTTWTPSNWMNPTGGTVLPNLHNRRTESDSTLTVNKYFEFNSSNGFLDCTFTHDPGPGRVWFDRRYAAGDGTLSQDFMGAALGFPSPPYIGQCVATFPASSPPYPNGPPVGVDGNSFGKLYTYQHGLLTSVRWINGNSPAGWYAKHLTRDAATGWIMASYDTAGLATGYLYDGIGRVTSVSPPGEAATSVTYPSTTQTLASRNGGPGLSLSQEYDYDGLGRLIRERRSMPGNQTAKQFSLFDPRGAPYFKSEWLPNAASESLSGDLATTCPSSNGSYPTLRPSAAPGSYQLCYDPLGRPQMTVGTNHSSLVTADRTDGSAFYSDTRESVTTGCVNGTYSGGFCFSGSDSTTTAFHDAFGRVTSVVEPSGGSTATYGYDVNGKLTSVSQGVQSRSFVYDPFGFLRQETTPEEGTVSYDYGSLGNVLTEALPDSVIVTHGYDYAGRLKSLTTSEGGGRTYLQNTYQETPGGDASLGKLVSRVATNYAVSPAPTVTDSFTYLGIGGRLSAQTTSISGLYGLSVTQKWRYNFLGLLSDHYHPRQASELPFVVSTTYDSGLPVAEYLNGIPTVTGLTYRSTGALATYAAGLGIGHDVTTTIDQDGPIARPSRIFTTGAAGNFDTGVYSYDGAGNIRQMGSDAFTYGLLSRLSSANFPGVGSQTFLYDIYGNMRAKNTFDPGGVIIPGQSRTYDMIAATNHISTEAYDPRGNITAGGTYTYDGLDRLVSDSSSGNTWRYLFSGDNERVVRVPPPGLGNPVYTLRDEKKRVITEYVGSILSRDNFFLGNQVAASLANTAVNGSLESWQFYFSDHLTSPRLITGIAGNALDTRKYWPFGEEVTPPATNQRLRFAGMERDVEASRYYDHARSHDFNLGRFLSPDPEVGRPGDPQTWNRYSYALNRPLTVTDPTGRQGEKDPVRDLIDEIVQRAPSAVERELLNSGREALKEGGPGKVLPALKKEVGKDIAKGIAAAAVGAEKEGIRQAVQGLNEELSPSTGIPLETSKGSLEKTGDPVKDTAADIVVNMSPLQMVRDIADLIRLGANLFVFGVQSQPFAEKIKEKRQVDDANNQAASE